MPETIELSEEAGIATLSFCRPTQLNAMNRKMMGEIIDALKHINCSETIRVAILTGKGKAFMAGADIKEYAAQTNAEFESFQSEGRSLYSLIEGSAKPYLAAVNGYAFGGGMEIALACDIVFAADVASFGLPEIKLALIPGGGGTQRLAKKTSLNFAKELLLSGRTATPEELLQRGFVNRIYPNSELIAQARIFAADLVKRPPDALRALKQLAELAAGGASESAFRLEMHSLEQLYRTPEAKERIQKFMLRSSNKE